MPTRRDSGRTGCSSPRPPTRSWAFGFYLAVGVLLPASAGAEPESQPAAYSYAGGQLSLLLPSPTTGTTTLEWQAIGRRGAPVGGAHRQRGVELKSGPNKIDLLVGDAGGHHLQYRLAGQLYRLWANRGVWYHTPRALAVTRVERTRATAAGVASRHDIHLAGGIRLEVQGTAPQSLELGRTMGYDQDYGVRVSADQALALVARGNVGGVIVTVAQRVGPKVTQYWDFPLVLGEELTRYVIPLRKVLPRLPRSQPLRSIYAVALRVLTPPTPSMILEVAEIGLTQRPPLVQAARLQRGGVAITISSPAAGAEIKHSRPGVEPGTVALSSRGAALVRDPEAQRFWLCYRTADGARGCDPPDAPSTSYGVPSPPGRAVLIDDFEALTSVSSWRLPTTAFASSPALQQTLLERRHGGALQLSYQPQGAADYAGYQTPLPAGLRTESGSLELTLRGKVATEVITVGLRDSVGREPRVRLRAYLDGLGDDWRTVQIPLEAFQAALATAGESGPRRLGKLVSLSVTMGNAGAAWTHQLELRRLRWLPAASPLAVACFDGEDASQTAVGGRLAVESRLGARLDAQFGVPGKRGKGLGTSVEGLAADRGYAMISFGLGNVDARRYKTLCFWVRGKKGGEDVTIYLADGRSRARLTLGAELQVTPSWQRAVLPLAAFKGKVDLGALKAIVLAWEERAIPQEELFFDELTLE